MRYKSQDKTYFSCVIYIISISRVSFELISDDRKNILKTNRKEIQERISLGKTSLLDKLHEDQVITLHEKEFIEVRM